MLFSLLRVIGRANCPHTGINSNIITPIDHIRNEKPTLWVKLRVLRYTSEEAAPFFPSLPLVLRRTGLKRRRKAAAEEIGLALEAARWKTKTKRLLKLKFSRSRNKSCIYEKSTFVNSLFTSIKLGCSHFFCLGQRGEMRKTSCQKTESSPKSVGLSFYIFFWKYLEEGNKFHCFPIPSWKNRTQYSPSINIGTGNLEQGLIFVFIRRA